MTVRLGKRVPLDLLPAARELTMQATAVVIEQARAKGREISCKAGCGACCRQLVVISIVEALSLVDLVAALPPDQQRTIRERFSDALRRLESARMLDPSRPKGQRALRMEIKGEVTQQSIAEELVRCYFSQGIPCPFLENESCSIHPDRPIVCREYHVTSPSKDCANLFKVKVNSVQPPLHMSSVLARVISRSYPTFSSTIPLVLSLEWAEANGGQLRQTYDGLEMFQTLLSEIDREHERPFDERTGMGT
ncbi:MAG: YkgJ family cysteine cluster protein [Syntrophaceae bacterium]